MPMLDIFSDDAFKVTTLSDVVNSLPFTPGRIAEMGLFSEKGIPTTSMAIERIGNVLRLVPPTPRGGPGTTAPKSKRNMLSISIPHFQNDDAVMAEEVQGVRAKGSETELETMMEIVAGRGQEHSQNMAVTQEYARVGAVKGVVTYSDGSTLDLFSTFGVSQLAEVNFDLANASPAAGALRKTCASVVRSIATELGGVSTVGVRALCGDNFFDALIAHPEVRETYVGWSEAKILREGYIEPNGKSYGAFDFGGIVWENYRGAVDGTSFIDTNKCHIFPVGVPGLFVTRYAPADYNETVNTIGQRIYTKVFPMANGKGYDMEVQMNNIEICTRPRVLVKGKRTA